MSHGSASEKGGSRCRTRRRAGSVERWEAIVCALAFLVPAGEGKALIPRGRTPEGERCLRDLQDYVITTLKRHIRPVPDGSRPRAAHYQFASWPEDPGDTLITAAGASIIPRLGAQLVYLCGSDRGSADLGVSTCDPAEAIRAVGEFGSVFYQGGGNWGDVWEVPHQARLWTAAHVVNSSSVSFLSMPQSMHYTHGHNGLRDSKIFGLLAANLRPTQEIALMFRQHSSFDMATQMFPEVKVELVPDIVFSMKPPFKARAASVDVFILIRRDRESNVGDTRKVIYEAREILHGAGLKFMLGDWEDTIQRLQLDVDRTMYRNPGSGPGFLEATVDTLAKLMATGRVVVTDRLHASIMAAMLGVPHIMIENNYGKLNGTRSTAWGFSSHCSERTMQGQFATSFADAFKMVVDMYANAPQEVAS